MILSTTLAALRNTLQQLSQRSSNVIARSLMAVSPRAGKPPFRDENVERQWGAVTWWGGSGLWVYQRRGGNVVCDSKFEHS